MYVTFERRLLIADLLLGILFKLQFPLSMILVIPASRCAICPLSIQLNQKIEQPLHQVGNRHDLHGELHPVCGHRSP